MKFKIIAVLSIFTLLLSACMSSKKSTIETYYKNEIPPNTIRIFEKLFCDKTEMDNFGWLEYMYWTKKVYGVNSSEYKTTIPDTLSWI